MYGRIPCFTSDTSNSTLQLLSTNYFNATLQFLSIQMHLIPPYGSNILPKLMRFLMNYDMPKLYIRLHSCAINSSVIEIL
jgi:hypothetical protein